MMKAVIWSQLLFLVISSGSLVAENSGSIAKTDLCKELVIDCTKDNAKELCPEKCSEPQECKLADCSASRNLEFCPITCAKEAKQEKVAVTPNGRENIYLQISDITLPAYGYKKTDFSDEAKCIPNKAKNTINVYGAMTGYDAIQGNPMSSLVDPGVKSRIFLHDCKFGYLDFVSDVRNNLQCDSDFSMKTIESMDQYEQERKSSNAFSAGAAASATAGFWGIKGSASASYTRSSNSDQMASEKVLEKYKGEIKRAKATCLTHSVTISDIVRPVFTPDFILHLEDMDAATRNPDEELKREAVANFINEFGTHYAKETKLGAELIYERRFETKGKSIQEKKERNECVRDEVAVSVGVESSTVNASANAHYDNKDCEGMKSGSDFTNNEGFEAVKTISRGSRPINIKKWIDASFTPVAIRRKLDDISNLFKDRWMTKSVFYGFDRNLVGSDIKEMYNKYIKQYCSLILYGILDENCNVIACRDSNFKCYNGGTCFNFEGSPRCDCPAETYGKFCEIAWFLAVEEKTCKATKGVTIVPNEPFTNIVDCASACKAKIQNTMFAFENKNSCKESKTGCQCHCIESVTNDCTTIDEEGFTLYKFRTETAAEYFLADTQEECSDINTGTIVSVDSAEGCQKAVKSLGVDNPDVFVEDQPSVPNGCYVYTPSNKLYFNQHSTGLDKAHWKYDTRMVCRDLKISMETADGCEEIEVTSDLDILNCRTGIYKIQRQVVNQKPVFKHETKEQYLFYMKKGKGFWMFGSEAGVDNGGIMNGICNDVGENIVNVPVETVCPSRWFYWSKSASSWSIDSSMSIRCRDSSNENSIKDRAILASEEAEDECESSPGDLCVTLPCGLNAICDASIGDVKCSCPGNMVGDPKLKCEDFDSSYSCIITTPLECMKEAKKLGLDIGNKYYAFEGDSYSHKGCYFNDDNTAYFGAGGSIKQMVEMARANEDSWDSNGKKSLTKRCLVAGYNLISEGQKCSTIDSDDYIVNGKTIDDYAQICKSMSNMFSVDKDGKGYCHIGTRQAGRCLLENDPTMNLYEIKYPGYTLAEEGFHCEDIGMKATEELKSCKASVTTIQKINPDFGTSVNERTLRNQPKGCYVAENTINFNTDSTDVSNVGSRQVCSGPRCNGYPTTDWNCCNPISQCGKGEGDCDTDDDCVGDLICGSSRDSSNNCKNEFIYSRSFWAASADCCTEPECSKNADCNTSSNPDKKICQAGRCIRCRGGDTCCTLGEKCYEGEGDCDNDDECMPGLRCGKDNCRIQASPWEKGDDCCYKPASCPVVTVQKVTDEGKYFISTENELRQLFNYDDWDASRMDIVQEGDCGFEWVKGTEKEQQWTGCYTGEIIAWKKDFIGRRNCHKCEQKKEGKGYDLLFPGQWSAGDTIKSKACSLVDPCFNGEQDRYETGIDCGGDCKKKCSPELRREIPWLLLADPTK